MFHKVWLIIFVNFLVSFLRRWFFIGILFCLLFVFFYYHLSQYLTMETLQLNYLKVANWTEHHYYYAVILYVILFTMLIACGIPCATILTLLGGFLFGSIGILYAMVGTTFGGFLLFLAVRTAVSHRITERSPHWIKKLQRGFQKNAFNYLILLRLIPIFPCWISNISAGILNVPMRIFLLATMIGITPSTLVYGLLGRGLDKFFITEQPLNWWFFLSPAILYPLLGALVLALIPIIYRYLKKSEV